MLKIVCDALHTFCGGCGLFGSVSRHAPEQGKDGCLDRCLSAVVPSQGASAYERTSPPTLEWAVTEIRLFNQAASTTSSLPPDQTATLADAPSRPAPPAPVNPTAALGEEDLEFLALEERDGRGTAGERRIVTQPGK